MTTIGVIVKIILFIITWFVVPAVFIGMFLLGQTIVKSQIGSANRVSVKFGFWAGMIAFVIYFVSISELMGPPSVPSVTIGEMKWIGLLSGGGIGYLLIKLVLFYVPTRLVGVVVSLLTFLSLSLFTTYLLIQSWNELVFASTLGFSLVVLVHGMLKPEKYKAILLWK